MGKVIRLNNKTEKELKILKTKMIQILTGSKIDPVMEKFYNDLILADDNLIIQICIEKTMEQLKNENTNNK